MQGQIAIGSGGLFGVGPGQSVQKIFYLPEAQTDFILAVIAEELGAIGVFALLFLYGLIAYAGLRAAKRARSLYSALIAVGMTTLIVSQALLNAFAVLGLAPLTGVPLPFVSYGSTQPDRDAGRDGPADERRLRHERARARRGRHGETQTGRIGRWAPHRRTAGQRRS